MSLYKIQGGKILTGELALSGSLDSTCSLISASLLCPTGNRLFNCSDESHVKKYISSLEQYGIRFDFLNNVVSVESTQVMSDNLFIQSFRYPGFTELLFAIISRFKRVSFSTSDDEIGNEHLWDVAKVVRDLGIKSEYNHGIITYDVSQYKGGHFYFYYPTSLQIRLLLLIAVLSEGETIIEINTESITPDASLIQLHNLLCKMGAQITGLGTEFIKVKGRRQLHSTEFILSPAKHEICSYLCAAAITGGCLTIKNVFYDMSKDLALLEKCGCKIVIENDSIIMAAPNALQAIGNIKSEDFVKNRYSIIPYLFPLLAKSNGLSMIEDDGASKIRQTINELIKMEASIGITQNTITIEGTPSLKGSNLNAKYPSVAKVLISAALIAEGETLLQVPNSLDNSLRSYVGNLKLLGANIAKVE